MKNVNSAFGVFLRQAGHQELADRLVEIQYELTDRLAFYLCGRKPGNGYFNAWLAPNHILTRFY